MGTAEHTTSARQTGGLVALLLLLPACVLDWDRRWDTGPGEGDGAPLPGDLWQGEGVAPGKDKGAGKDTGPKKDKTCVPQTCATALRHCGSKLPDGCGGTYNCAGTCPVGLACVKGYCGGPPKPCKAGSCLAFPGAEGAGRFALGGRGGDVCRVTSLNDKGAGSLRHCALTQKGARTVIFAVSGIITLDSPLVFTRDRLTLAGQTAPGGGIMIRGYQVGIVGSDIIVRHLRFRPGDLKIKKCDGNSGGGSFTADALSLKGKRIIVDHVSASWGVDEVLTGYGEFTDATIQYSIVAQGLGRTGIFEGKCDGDYKPGGSKTHSAGGVYKPKFGDMVVSLHHNLYAHSYSGNPTVGSYSSSQRVLADIRNNVIYSCPIMGLTSGNSKDVRVNYVSNFAVLGPSSVQTKMFTGAASNNVKLYRLANFLDATKDKVLAGKNPGGSLYGGVLTKVTSPHATAPVTTHGADTALRQVLAWAGARPWGRDQADKQFVADVQNNTGGLVNKQSSYGAIVAAAPDKDTDSDGMPDAWEQVYGSDPKKADNNGDLDGDGYTNLEAYLHWAARASR